MLERNQKTNNICEQNTASMWSHPQKSGCSTTLKTLKFWDNARSYLTKLLLLFPKFKGIVEVFEYVYFGPYPKCR